MDVIRYHTDRGHVACLLVKRGKKYIHIIPMDSKGIKIKKVPNDEARYFHELPTEPKTARKIFRRAAKRFGVTKSAKQYLKG